MGQQLTMTDGSGTTTNTYDVLGRVSSEVNGRGNRLAYEYDVAGRRTAMVDPENGRTTYAYDNNGWLIRLTDPQSGATVYTHDKLGRELTKTLPIGVTSSHVYDAVGNETLQEERDASGTLLASYASTYNPVGMKLSVTEKDGSVLSYRYSGNYALAREERTGSAPYVTEYFYDAAGNPLRTLKDGAQTSSFINAANQITRKVGPSGTINFAYDADGNLSSETNANGSGKSYVFDGQDRLIAVEVMNAGGALAHRSEFAYDGFGRLMKSTEFTRNGGNWVKQSERGRVFDGLDTVQERSENNQVLAQLTRDGNIGGVLSRKAGANTTFFGYDGNGNVTLLSDANGNSVGHYRYDGFGNALEVSGSAASGNDHRFSTKELHAPSGLYYYGFRFYSPALGRWINRDPIREMGGVNLYRMAGSNPVSFVDLYGLSPLTWGYPLPSGILFSSNPIGQYFDKTSDQYIAGLAVTGPFANSLLEHYIWGRGKNIILSQNQVLESLKPSSVDIRECDNFQKDLKSAKVGTTFHGEYRWVISDENNPRGGLGDYTFIADVDVIKVSPNKWKASGTASVYDKWDFDWKWYKLSNPETAMREKTTALGSLINGTPFKINSEPIVFFQKNTNFAQLRAQAEQPYIINGMINNKRSNFNIR